jgi:hypothetical protein
MIGFVERIDRWVMCRNATRSPAGTGVSFTLAFGGKKSKAASTERTKTLRLVGFYALAQLGQGVLLDLADALPGQAEAVTDLLERQRLLVV